MRKKSYTRKAIANRFRVQRFRQKNQILNHYNQPEPSENHEYEEIPEIANNTSTRDLLTSWVNFHGVTMRAVNDLLKILKKAGWYDIYIIPSGFLYF